MRKLLLASLIAAPLVTLAACSPAGITDSESSPAAAAPAEAPPPAEAAAPEVTDAPPPAVGLGGEMAHYQTDGAIEENKVAPDAAAPSSGTGVDPCQHPNPPSYCSSN